MQSNRSSQSESGRSDFKSEAQSIIDAVRDDLAKRAVAVTSGAIFGFTGTVGGVTAAAAGGFKTTRSEEGLEQVDFRVQRNHHILNGEHLAQSRGRDGSIELDPENEYLRGSGLIDENPQTPVELDPENEYLRGSGLIDEGQEGSGGSPRGNPRRNRDQGGGNSRGNNRAGNSAANEDRSRDQDGALVYNELKHPQFVTARKMNQWGDPKSPHGLGDIFNLEPLFGAPASGCYRSKTAALVKAAELYKNSASTVTIGECWEFKNSVRGGGDTTKPHSNPYYNTYNRVGYAVSGPVAIDSSRNIGSDHLQYPGVLIPLSGDKFKREETLICAKATISKFTSPRAEIDGCVGYTKDHKLWRLEYYGPPINSEISQSQIRKKKKQETPICAPRDYYAEGQGLLRSAGNDAFKLNTIITKTYRELYLSNPAQFKWAGLGAYASNNAGFGIWLMGDFVPGEDLEDIVLFGLNIFAGSNVNRNIIRSDLAKGNLAIFQDMYWQHKAFECGGYNEVLRYAKAKNLDISKYGLQSWQLLEEGKVWESVRMLAAHEQLVVLPKHVYNNPKTMHEWGELAKFASNFDEFFTTGRGSWLGIPPFLTTPTGTGKDFYAYYNYDPKRSFANTADRWQWVEKVILPEWQRVEAVKGKEIQVYNFSTSGYKSAECILSEYGLEAFGNFSYNDLMEFINYCRKKQ